MKDCGEKKLRRLKNSPVGSEADPERWKAGCGGKAIEGIAHDFNNLLLAILGNASIAKTLLSPNDKVFEALDRIENAAIMAKGLAKQIVTLSKGEPVRQPSHIEDILKNSADIVLRGTNARCEFTLAEDLWAVYADEGEIPDVFNNILLNAMQSMPAGGVITVEAENFAIDGDSVLPLKKGGYVRVSIRDEGCGIPEKDIGRIFEPFFTTKQNASGLGLSLSYSIVSKYGGWICADSNPGRGSVFYVYLPALKKEPSAPPTGEPEKSAAGRRILVMDDEELVRDVMDAMLCNLGCEVSFTASGEEAVNIFMKARESGRSFDAVILDLTVPGGMGGKDTMQKLLEIDPDVKGIVSSGYSKDPLISDFRKYGFRAAVAKPFRASEFARVVKNVLAEET